MRVPRDHFFVAYSQLKDYHELMLMTLERAKHNGNFSPEILEELTHQVTILSSIVAGFNKCVDTSNLKRSSSNLH